MGRWLEAVDSRGYTLMRLLCCCYYLVTLLFAGRAQHAAAVHQLQETSLQLATLQPQVQLLQHQQQCLEQERDALRAEAANTTSAAAAQQERSQQETASLQQQLAAAHAHVTRLQQELEAVHAELSSAQHEVAACGSRAASAEKQLAECSSTHLARLQETEAAFVSSLQGVQEHMQWLNSTYFQTDTPGRSATAGGAGPECQQPQRTTSAEAVGKTPSAAGDSGVSTADGADVSVGATAATPAGPSAVGAASPSSKLQQLRQDLIGSDGERLLQLYQQYKAHKAQLVGPDNAITTTSSSSADTVGEHQTGRGHTPTALNSRPVAVQQVQQQVLRLEACLLKYLLSLQDALDEARNLQQQQQQCSSRTSFSLCSPRSLAPSGSITSSSSSGSRLVERPGTGLSSSLRCATDLTASMSSRSTGGSSLGAQLLTAMRREKQQLAQELRKMHDMQRTPLAVAATTSATAFPWQRSSGSLLVQPANGVEMVASAGSQPESFSEVDEVLALLQGCQLDHHQPVASAAGHGGEAQGRTGHSSKAGSSGSSGSGSSKPIVAAATSGSHRSPGRSVSTGHAANSTRAALSPTLHKSGSVGVSSRTSSKPGWDRGIGSFRARK